MLMAESRERSLNFSERSFFNRTINTCSIIFNYFTIKQTNEFKATLIDRFIINCYCSYSLQLGWIRNQSKSISIFNIYNFEEHRTTLHLGQTLTVAGETATKPIRIGCQWIYMGKIVPSRSFGDVFFLLVCGATQQWTMRWHYIIIIFFLYDLLDRMKKQKLKEWNEWVNVCECVV